MRKIKRILIENAAMLNHQEMMDLSGGAETYTCRTNEACTLFIEEIGITVPGKCHSYQVGTTISCYCVNGNYQTSPGHKTSCWR